MPSAAEWLSQLVRIPSVNPEQAGPRSGPGGEERIAGLLAEWFGQLGAGTVEVEQVAPGRPNVYGIWHGSSDRWAALDVHTDTVGVEAMTGNPFSGEIRNGRVWGRGAVDTKASIGVALASLEAMQSERVTPEANIVIAATIDEEVNMLGACAFREWLQRQPFTVSELLVAEPTGCTPVHGHKGAVRFQVEVEGRPAHSAQPELGHNAIVDAAELIRALNAGGEALKLAHTEDPLAPATLSITIIEGGTGTNVVPDRCIFKADRRVIACETTAQVLRDLEREISGSKSVAARIKVLHTFESFYRSPDCDWIRQLQDWSGHTATLAPYGTNASIYRDLPNACAVMGPGDIAQAHRVEEWVEISELDQMEEILRNWWGIKA